MPIEATCQPGGPQSAHIKELENANRRNQELLDNMKLLLMEKVPHVLNVLMLCCSQIFHTKFNKV